MAGGFEADGEVWCGRCNRKNIEQTLVVSEVQTGSIIRYVFESDDFEGTAHHPELVPAKPLGNWKDLSGRRNYQEDQSREGQHDEMGDSYNPQERGEQGIQQRYLTRLGSTSIVTGVAPNWSPSGSRI